MNNDAPRRRFGFRGRLPLVPRHEPDFRWRGTEISRMEGFTDAVFGFAVTLLVVALEVPRTYEGLLDVVRGFPAFIICFTLLMTFWNAHYRYHRRYGLEDAYTRLLTMGILVLVLFYVYPLKFLFTFLTVQVFGLEIHDPPTLKDMEQVRSLYIIYGAGFAGTWGLYTLLYAHAWRRRSALELTAAETLHTRAAVFEMLIYLAVCLASIVLVWTTRSAWLPGMVYFLIGPLQGVNGWLHGRKLRRIR